MKKVIVLLLLIVMPISALAGGYYHRSFQDEYDKTTDLYFTSAVSYEDGGFLKGTDHKAIDVYIYSPETNKGVYLFGQKNKSRITELLFESAFDNDSRSMLFNTEDKHAVRNNHSIDERTPKDRILVLTYNDETKESALWTASKNGENLKKLKDLNKIMEWHVDVRNEKIRFITKNNNSIKVESVDW